VSEIVRVVSDGEEIVLSTSEAVHIRPRTAERDLRAPLRLAVQYLGFNDVQGRREYVLSAQQGAEARRYTVWIELTAFAGHRALLQDGPDICYQKLLRELAGSELRGCERIGVTEGDLAAYRETHTPPVRRSFSLPGPKAPTKGERREGE
jgi:hypothetical protein